MKNLAIIPARGGSSRIPGKNIRNFLNKPIIQYSIETAISSNLFSEVMVSTDSDDIREVAEKCGAKVPFKRSEVNSNEFATLFDVFKEVMDKYKERGQHFDNVCCILATAPFITVENLTEAYDHLLKRDYISVFPVTKFSYPVRRALEIESSTQTIKMIWPEYQNVRSQDIPDAYHDCGQFYWASPKRIIPYNSFFTPASGVVELPQMVTQDIDNEDDWQLAEVKYKLIKPH